MTGNNSDGSIRTFSKTVAIKATDDEERTATGVVLTPFELDHQLDFFRPEGIQAMFNPTPADGVMHTAFPDDAAELEFNQILEDEEDLEIDGVEFEAGDWVVRRKYNDDDLWSLVEDGILAGFSIGGDVTEEIQFESIDDLPEDVEIPDEVDPDSVPDKYWPPAEITNGFVSEISDVDIPAVPKATHAVVKALGGLEMAKNLVDEVSGEEEFVELMQGRGHTEEDAERLWAFLLEHVADDVDVPGDTESASTIQNHDMTNNTDDAIDSIDDVDDATLGKRFKRFLFGDGEAETDDGTGPAPEDLDLSKAFTVLKEGRTLNSENRAALMAAHDAIESALASEVDFETNRFTDNEDVEFSIEEFGKLDAGAATDGGGGADTDDTPSPEEREKLLKAVTPEQADIVVDALEEFVDTHGENADVRSFEGWMIEHDFQGELDPDQLVAINVSLQDFFQDRDFAGEALISEFRAWLGRQTNNPDLIEMSDPDPDDDGTDKTNSNPDPDSDTQTAPPEWAKALVDQVEANKERLDDIFGEPEPDLEKALEDAPAWAKALFESTQQNTERIEQIGKQGGHSTQLSGGADIEGNGDGTEPDRKFSKDWDNVLGLSSGGDA